MGTAATLDDQVLAAQAQLVFDRSRLANLLGVPLGLLVCWVLWGQTSTLLLAFWLAAKLSVVLWRIGIDRGQRRDGGGNPRRWMRHYQIAHVVDGLVYGALGTWLLPSYSGPLHMLMLATLAGAASVGFVVLSNHFASLMAYELPLLLPTLGWLYWTGGEIGLFALAAGSLFLLLICVDGWRAAADTAESLRLRFRMGELAAQRQQAMELAQQHSAVKNRFLATMSHEMRTPLHGMLGIVHLLRTSAPPATQPQLDTLQRTGEHLLALISDVLDFSRIEGGHLQLHAADFDLAALIAEVGELTHASGRQKGLTVTIASSLPSPCWVHGDVSRLRQVLLNLTGNALKFTDRGEVALSAHRDDHGHTVIEVRDTGCGFDPDHVDQVFEAFHQEDAANDRRHGGAGLGLAIARELARLMDGELQAQSQPGAGSCFTLSLRLPAGRPLAEAAAAAAPASPLQGQVLLVEDNPVNAMVAQAMLQRLGLRVDAAGNGAEALERLRAQRYDLVLMDCQMPVLDGLEATRRIRRDEAAAPRAPLRVVGLTANASEHDRLACLDAGMDDYLAKPFREQQLHRLLARYLSAT